jgi:hypothetical protein
VVDFPWSTCPMMMMFRCGFSLLLMLYPSFLL